jgi:early secretory antigenic target protein ESAT-6
MSGDGQIAVTFEHMRNAAESTRCTATKIDDELSDLQRTLDPIVAEWTGGAAESFQYQHRLWIQAATDLHSTLTQIAVVLAGAHDAYRGTESAVVQKWSG